MLHDIMTNGNNKLAFQDHKMSTSLHHEDTGFCSGEDYMDVHSPTDSSEDSVEVKVSSITLNQNKRKFNDVAFSGPLKKRMCLKVKAEESTALGKTPFRPWSPPKNSSTTPSTQMILPNFAVPLPVKQEPLSPVKSRPFSYFRPPSPIQPTQNEPVPLIVKREKSDTSNSKTRDARVPIHPHIAKLSTAETERMILKAAEEFPDLKKPCPSIISQQTLQDQKKSEQKREQRNYKNMTRERRIEANARERTRVHTISAAFESLRHAVPSYSNQQKLSKLSVLRIACSYIMTLSSLVQDEVGPKEPSTSECIDLVSRTIQREGKLRKKKDDDND